MDLVFAPSQIETWSLDRLRPYARNAKIHGTDQVAKIAASMAKFGWTVPCMVADDGELIAGHGRVLAATMLGLTDVPVIRLGHLDEAERRAYRIADNKLTELGEWDEAVLRDEIAGLLAEDFDLSLLGIGSIIGGFDAAQAHRRLRGFRASRAHVNTLIAASGDTITARARWLVRNNGYAANAVESFASNVVGDGIKPSSTIADAAKKEELQALWLAWTDDADAEGLTDFYGLQRRAAREVFLSGEVFIRTGQRVLMRRGAIGQIRRGRLAIVAEVRSLAHVLGQTVGRTFQATCDAGLGDTRCAVGLENPAFKGSGTVLDLLRDRAFTASGLGGFSSGWFTFGTVEWIGGANVGRRTEIIAHDLTDGIAVLTLLEAPVPSIAGGDAFTICAGCDKRIETCGTKFANTANFRGFPHIPGQDAILRYATKDGGHEGSVL